MRVYYQRKSVPVRPADFGSAAAGTNLTGGAVGAAGARRYRMKILITSDWYVPAVNGVVTSVLNLRRGLEAAGHEVRILTLSQTGRSFEQDGVTQIGSLAAGKVYPGARLRSHPAGKWIRELLEWGPDVVHSQCEFSTFPLARRIAETLDVPLVHTYHTVYEDYTHYFSPSEKWGRRAVTLFSRWVAAQTDCMITPTEKIRALLEGYGVKVPLRVIPSGIDVARFEKPLTPERKAQLQAELGLDPARLTLVSIGRLAEEKNVEELIGLMARLKDRPVTLVLVGDGPARTKLETLARSSGAAVVFAGMVPPERVAEYYRLGDLFVSASQSETQGMTYVEALASGVPTLCRADPCLDGLVENGKNGWQYHDTEEFLRDLAAFSADPELRLQLSRAAEQSAQSFSAETFGRRVEAVYREAIALRRQRCPEESA